MFHSTNTDLTSFQVAIHPRAAGSSSSASRTYRLYGLDLTVPWPVPGLTPAPQSSVDVEVICSDKQLSDQFQERPISPSDPEPACALREDGSVYLHWPGLCEIAVSADGRTLTVHGPAGQQFEAFQTYPLTQALSFSLIKLGMEPLHATTIRMGEFAISLMGDCGFGKSTLAAEFIRRGHELLSDDLLVTRITDGEVFAYPGTGRLKLYPEVAMSVLGQDVRGKSLAPVATKLAIDSDSMQAVPERTPLKFVYVLDAPDNSEAIDHVTTEPLSGRDAVLQLLKNTYNDMMRSEERLRGQFAHAAGIVERVSVKRLSYPRSLERLHEVYDAIMADLHS